MKGIVQSTAIAFTFVTLVGTLTAAETKSHPIGKNGDVEFTQAVAVGTTVLQAGHYRFKHSFQDGQHYLLISRQRMAMRPPAGPEPINTMVWAKAPKWLAFPVRWCPSTSQSSKPRCIHARNRMDPRS